MYPNSDVVEKRRSDLINELRGRSPFECFEKIFDETIVSSIVRQTVTYATQKNVHQFVLSKDCIRKFIGILLFTGYHSLSREQLYCCEDDMDVHCVKKCMSRNRYLEIKLYLHISDNSELQNIAPEERDTLFMIRPIIDQLNEKFLQFGVFSEHLSTDVQMVICAVSPYGLDSNNVRSAAHKLSIVTKCKCTKANQETLEMMHP